jgi:hypothetical protein
VVALIRDAGLLDGGGSPADQHFSAEEAFAALADVLLRASEDGPSGKGFKALKVVGGPQDGSDDGDGPSWRRLKRRRDASPDDGGGRPAGRDLIRSLAARTTEARLMEALDVPDDLYDAADSSGAALLAALLCGHRRMRVDIADPSFGDPTSPPQWPNASADDKGDGGNGGDTASGDGGDGGGLRSSKAVEHERLARFVELMCLPIAAAMEGVDKRVHVVFSSVRQLAAARAAMAHTATVALGALSLDTRLEPRDSVVVLVAPTSALEPQARTLLAQAVNRTIIVVNPSFDTLRPTPPGMLLFAEAAGKGPVAREVSKYEPVYVLRGMTARYGDKRTAEEATLEDASGLDERGTSPWGGLRDFSSAQEAAALEEVGLSIDSDAPPPACPTTRETTSRSGGGVSGDGLSSDGGGTLGSLGTEEWAAAAAAAVAESVMSEETSALVENAVGLAALRANFPVSDFTSGTKSGAKSGAKSDVSGAPTSADAEGSPVVAAAESEVKGSAEAEGSGEAESSESGEWRLTRDVRTMLLREFPMPWRVFLQLTNCVDAATEQPIEQPWILVESFEAGEPTQREVNLAVLAYISESGDDALVGADDFLAEDGQDAEWA